MHACAVDGDRVPLHWAAARGDMQCLELLLKAGASTKLVDREGRSPAELAQQAEQMACYNRLVHGPSVPDSKMVFEGQSGASLQTALGDATKLKVILSSNDAAVVANTRDPDGDRYPLHWAAARGALRCAQLLIDAGADLNATDGAGKTPAALALAANQRVVHELLLSSDGTEVGLKGAATAQVVALAAQRRDVHQLV